MDLKMLQHSFPVLPMSSGVHRRKPSPPCAPATGARLILLHSVLFTLIRGDRPELSRFWHAWDRQMFCVTRGSCGRSESQMDHGNQHRPEKPRPVKVSRKTAHGQREVKSRISPLAPTSVALRDQGAPHRIERSSEAPWPSRFALTLLRRVVLCEIPHRPLHRHRMEL